ncbi:MAG: hypothetical protein KatS3mg017_0502 [Fimbriimonadales bacterium]|nr:MAG: hypothetical protein KatS3mg017_0502 [Fimbriimonadales bacterium]GIV07991.1 MAG: hypothetical protein KatS3mg019_0082 [Fimbriimonadales bacterium]
MQARDQGLGTFSIVGADPRTGEVGVAVASKFLAVGSVVPFAQAGVGAIATQSYANTTYGPRGLELLRQKLEPKVVLRRLTQSDPQRERRQVGIVDAQGRSATFTGKGCIRWAGGIAGKNFAAQGNILTGEAVVQAMAEAFQKTDGELALKLMAALEAGEQAGGDSRGKQSAAILVARKNGGYGGFDDRYIDLRVDDHPEPIQELRRLLTMQLRFRRQERAFRLYDRKQYQAAARAFADIIRDAPNDANAHYNYACILALAGSPKAALRHLKHALELDRALVRIALNDPDLNPLRNKPEFQDLLKQYQ